MDASLATETTAAVRAHARKGRKRRRRYFGRVYQDKRTGLWCLRIRRHGQDIHEVVGADRSLAEARLAAIVEATAKEQALGVRTIARVTWADLAPRLLSWLHANHEATTYAAEVGRVRSVGEWLGSRVLDDVTTEDVETFLAVLRNDRKATPATANRYRSILRVAFRQAVGAGFARGNPAEGIKWAREQARPVPFLDGAALDRILARTDKRYRPLLTLAADSGLRRGELLALAWEDVDTKGNALTVRRSKNHDARRVPLTPRAVVLLDALDAARGPAPLHGGSLVFAGMDPSGVSKAWKAAAKLAGLPSLRLHDARHAYASGLARAGVQPSVIGALIGDKTPSVVYRYSRHAPQDAAAEAVALLSKARGQDAAGTVGKAGKDADSAPVGSGKAAERTGAEDATDASTAQDTGSDGAARRTA